MKTSAMSPVASRVFTRLSPSEPPGRVSCLIVMFGLAAVKASITAFALATSASSAPVRSVIVVAPALPSPLLLPRLPALHPGSEQRGGCCQRHERYAPLARFGESHRTSRSEKEPAGSEAGRRLKRFKAAR